LLYLFLSNSLVNTGPSLLRTEPGRDLNYFWFGSNQFWWEPKQLHLFEVLACVILAIRQWHKLTPTLQDGWSALYARGKLATTPKIRMIALFRRCVGFGVRIAVWFRCSLSKQMVSGNRIYELPCDFKKRRQYTSTHTPASWYVFGFLLCVLSQQSQTNTIMLVPGVMPEAGWPPVGTYGFKDLTKAQ